MTVSETRPISILRESEGLALNQAFRAKSLLGLFSTIY